MSHANGNASNETRRPPAPSRFASDRIIAVSTMIDTAAVASPAGPRAQHVRRLLHRGEERDRSIVVMAWRPGQKTMVQDRSRIQCIEDVRGGGINGLQCDLVKQDNGQCQFEPANACRADVGSVCR